ncbi:ankyrin repeat domain-containing protein [Lysobacter sp. CA199]|uniref:ankyrin repeat domain-containing protein n=1 Tax=Lysobacter sp. CA199 TaxID=3455608 RepID=UPI003F8D61A1
MLLIRRLTRSADTRMLAAFVVLMLHVCATGTAFGKQSMRASEVVTDARTAELAEAAAAGDAARVRERVAAGAQVDGRGAKGVTPLQWALYHHSLAGMRALLAAGADPKVAAHDCMTVVHLAAMADDPRYLRALLEHGADPMSARARTAIAG